MDTRHSDELVNRRQFYVSVSRAVQDARVYTDDHAALARAVSREQTRENALSIAAAPQADQPAPSRPGQSSATAPSQSPLDVADRSRRQRSGGDKAARTLGQAPELPTPRALLARTLALMQHLDPPDIPVFRNRDHDHDR